MAISLVCGKCGQVYRVEEALAGKKVRCRHCQFVMPVPKPKRPAEGDAPIRFADEASEVEALPAAGSGRRQEPDPLDALDMLDPLSQPLPAPAMPAPPMIQPGRSAGDMFSGLVAVMKRRWGLTLLVVAVLGLAAAGYVGMGLLSGRMTHPPLPAMAEVAPGVHRAKVTLTSAGWVSSPSMDLWVYFPAGKHADRSLPCIFMASGGGNLLTGVSVRQQDTPQHIAYARAGFAVVAFDVDGVLKSRGRATEAEAREALKAFIKAEGGVANVRKAINYALDRLPEANPDRLYIAGHSSAGTLALQAAAREPRLAGCVAYAPCVDIEAFLRTSIPDTTLDKADKAVGGLRKFIQGASPVNISERIECPVLLFVAEDDDPAIVSKVRAFASSRPGQFRLATVQRGGHQVAVFRDGIPAGVAFLGKLAGLSDGAIARGAEPVAVTVVEEPAPAPALPPQWVTDTLLPPTPPADATAAQPPPPPADDDLMPPPPPPAQDHVATLPPPEEPDNLTPPPTPPAHAVIAPALAVAPPPQPVIPEAPPEIDEREAIMRLQRLGSFVTMRDEIVESVDFRQSLDLDQALDLAQRLERIDTVRITATCLTPARVGQLGTLRGLRRLDAESGQVTDAHLKVLAELTGLQELVLSSNPITDAGLAHLKPLVDLKRLYLKETRISSAGLVHLQDLTALNILDLSQTRITDAGLPHLREHKNLIGLLLRNTSVTDAGIATLRKSLPRANIVGP